MYIRKSTSFKNTHIIIKADANAHLAICVAREHNQPIYLTWTQPVNQLTRLIFEGVPFTSTANAREFNDMLTKAIEIAEAWEQDPSFAEVFLEERPSALPRSRVLSKD